MRPIINRGRAVSNELGLSAGFEQLEPELTVTSDRACYSPFGPAMRGRRLDTDLLVLRTTSPLTTAADAPPWIVDQAPPATGARIWIR